MSYSEEFFFTFNEDEDDNTNNEQDIIPRDEPCCEKTKHCLC